MGQAVDMEWVFLDPDRVLALLDGLGFRREGCWVRYPCPEAEHPSRRAYFLMQRAG